MSHGHIKEVEFKKGSLTYSLSIDTEDPNNLVIEECVVIDHPSPIKIETEVDPEIFQDGLNIDDWQTIKELLK